MLLAVAAMMGISFVSCDKNDSEEVFDNLEIQMNTDSESGSTDDEDDNSQGQVVEYDEITMP